VAKQKVMAPAGPWV